MTDRPTITDTRVLTDTTEPDLPAWLGDADHTLDGQQLTLHTQLGDMRPRPGWTLIKWTDGEITVASPRTASRVYGPQGQLGRYVRLLRTLTTAEDAPTHCHTHPPTWDGGGPCQYCTALLEARAELATLDEPKEHWPMAGITPQLWPLQRVLTEVRCGSQDWTWDDEWADLDQRHPEKLAVLEQSIKAEGINTPLLLGPDGRLWDGHHRLRIAVRLGLTHVPVETAG